jgi:hypothetical protein
LPDLYAESIDSLQTEVTSNAADTVDYSYGSAITLPNSGEELELSNYGSNGSNGSVICSVNYGSSDFPTGSGGVSIQLSAGITSMSELLKGLNWCNSKATFSTGDYGSPGKPNTVCQ